MILITLFNFALLILTGERRTLTTTDQITPSFFFPEMQLFAYIYVHINCNSSTVHFTAPFLNISLVKKRNSVTITKWLFPYFGRILDGHLDNLWENFLHRIYIANTSLTSRLLREVGTLTHANNVESIAVLVNTVIHNKTDYKHYKLYVTLFKFICKYCRLNLHL